MVNKAIIGIFFLSIFFSFNSYSQPLIPELKKSINTYCKTTKDFGNFKQCRGEVYSLLRKQGTDFIFKVDNSYRKDFFITCNRHKKNAFKFNECLFRQVSKVLGEDITLEEPVLVITEKNTNEDEVTKVIEMPVSTEQNILSQVISATFYVESGNTLTEGGLGSAVKINETQLATACHVVTDEYNNVNKFIRVSHVRDENNFRDAKLVKYDFLKDACILETSNISQYRSVAMRSFANLKIFEKIYAVGNPNGFIGRTAEGKIKNLYNNTPRYLKSRGYDPINLIETDAPLDKGNSGGGLYDTNGRLIGIVSACDVDIEATEAIKDGHYPCHRVNPINWSIPIDTFKQLAVFEYSANKEKDNSEGYVTKEEKEKSYDEYQNIWHFVELEELSYLENVNDDFHRIRFIPLMDEDVCKFFIYADILLPGNYQNFSYLKDKELKIKNVNEIFETIILDATKIDKDINDHLYLSIYLAGLDKKKYKPDLFLENNKISIEIISSDDFNINKIKDLLKSQKLSWSYQGAQKQIDKLYCK